MAFPSSSNNTGSATPLTNGEYNIKLGKYYITRLLGQDSSSCTYLAQHIETGQEVVIKEYLPMGIAHRDASTLAIVPVNDAAKERFMQTRNQLQQGILKLRQLNHPNIVKVQGIFGALGTVYYVMPQVGGKDIGQTAPAPDTITEAWLAPILQQLLEALQYLHSNGLQHGDICPGNILIQEGGTPVLIKPAPPLGPCDPYSDIYALGATCHHLITGTPPPSGTYRMAENAVYPTLASQAELHTRFSRDFLATIDQALAAHEPNHRQSAKDWLTALTTPKPKPIIPEPIIPEPIIPEPIIPEPIIPEPIPGPGDEPITVPILVANDPTPAKRTTGIPRYSKAIIAAQLVLLLGGGGYICYTLSSMQNQMETGAAAHAQALAETEAAHQAADEKAARLATETEEAKRREAENTRRLAALTLTARGISAAEYNKKLREAADEGNRELVQLLITAEADVNEADSNGWTPLLNAAYQGHTEIALDLIAAGADIEKDSDGWTPLLTAAQNGHTETALALIEKGANIEAENKNKCTPLYMAAQNGHTETALALIEKGANIEAGNKNNATPLYIAAQNGHTETARALIEEGAKIDARLIDDTTPLHVAARNGHTEAVLLLLEKGADIEVKDEDGATPLHLAAVRGNTETVRALIEKGANIEAKFKGNSTPLHAAAAQENSETVLLLIEKGADIKAKTKDGSTPLFIAAQAGLTENVLLLIEKGADIEAQSTGNATPLHIASLQGHHETVRALIKKGAKIEARLADNSTPLIIAAYEGKTECVRVLLKHGANRNAKDDSNKTALDWAREKGHTEIVELLQ